MPIPSGDPTIRTTSRLIVISSGVLVLLYLVYDLFRGDPALYMLLGVFLAGLFLTALLLIRGLRIIERRRGKEAIPFLVGTLALGIVLFQPDRYFAELFKSRVLFYGACEHPVAVLSLKLREDNTFEYNKCACIQQDKRYGSYSKVGDTVTLHFAGKPPEHTGNKYLIREDGLEEMEDEEAMEAIDDLGEMDEMEEMEGMIGESKRYRHFFAFPGME